MGFIESTLVLGSSLKIVAASVLLGFFIIFMSRWIKAPEIPVVNDYRWDFSRKKAHSEFMTDAKALIARGFKKFNGPFRIITPLGSRVILPTRFQDWVKTCKDLDHHALVLHEYFGSYPGMEGISATHDSSNILIDVVRNKLNQNGQCELFQEHITESLAELWTDKNEWHPVDWSLDSMRFVGRMSASVFVGSELSRNPEWQTLTITYTTNAFMAVRSLRLLPGFIRPMIHWFLPELNKVREQVRLARNMLQPIFDKRLARKSSVAGRSSQVKYNDTITWMEEVAAGRPFDPAAAQLGFALSALHTTSNLMKQTLYDICSHPELVQPLRDEVSKAVSESGWSTAGVFKMQLLDSVIKESQRLKPSGLVNLERKVLRDTVMPNGVKLLRGTNIAVDVSVMSNSHIYDHPEAFDGYRFLKIRQGGLQGSSSAALASSGPEHFDFGLGKSICPGRFFAANEIKVALASILMNYDVRLRDNQKPQVLYMGFEMLADPMGQIEVRRR